jgi:hypothetical protein
MKRSHAIAAILIGFAAVLQAQPTQITGLSDTESNRVVEAQFSSDGKRLVTTAANKTVRIWDAATGKPLSLPVSQLGTWQLVSVKVGEDGEWSSAPKELRRIRLITATHFTWIEHDVATGKALSVVGGTYAMNGGKYIESIDYAGEGMTGMLGKTQSFAVKIEGDKWQQTGVLPNGTKIEEVWERVR